MPVMRVCRFGGLAAVLVAVSACGAGWHREPALETRQVAARQQAQVWQHGVANQWHALRITADSVSGIPFFRPITCDSCRRSFPRAEVDSIQFGNPVAGFWKTMALIVSPFVLLAIAVTITCGPHCEL